MIYCSSSAVPQGCPPLRAVWLTAEHWQLTEAIAQAPNKLFSPWQPPQASIDFAAGSLSRETRTASSFSACTFQRLNSIGDGLGLTNEKQDHSYCFKLSHNFGKTLFAFLGKQVWTVQPGPACNTVCICRELLLLLVC